ncbi:MAG: tetratricopeptide repeat protein [Verrucomicrobiota bacterium]
MQSDWQYLWKRFLTTGVSLVVLLVAGVVLSVLQEPAWKDVRQHQPELNLKQVEGALGQGLMIGLLGGFRTIIADLVFIQVNSTWERKERIETEALIRLTTAIDPRPMFFWLNGSRMIAYDMPVWRIREAGGFDVVPQSIQDRIMAEQAERGLDYINEAKAYHPNDYRIPLENGQVIYNKIKDTERALPFYLEAYRSEYGPDFAGRIYAELLRQLNRDEEAYAFYRQHLSELPEETPLPRRNVVVERIRELEEELNLPALKRLPPQPGESFDTMQRVGIGEELYMP